MDPTGVASLPDASLLSGVSDSLSLMFFLLFSFLLLLFFIV
jgi:hypothetical protein